MTRALWVFFLSALCLQGCAKVSFESSNRVPTYVSTKPDHTHRFSVVGKKDFYFFGMIPAKQVVDLSEVMSSAGVLTSAGLQVEDFQTFNDKVLALLTLGFYTPRHYRVKAWGQLQQEDVR